MALSWNLYLLFLSGYVLCFAFFNIVTYLISSFYRKKFNQKSMRFGFLVSILLLLLFIPCQFLSKSEKDPYFIIEVLLLLGGSILSAWNSIILFLTMKKVRK